MKPKQKVSKHQIWHKEYQHNISRAHIDLLNNSEPPLVQQEKLFKRQLGHIVTINEQNFVNWQFKVLFSAIIRGPTWLAFIL